MKPSTPSASIPSPHLQPLPPLMYPIAASQDPHLVTTINCIILLIAQYQCPYSKSSIGFAFRSVIGVELDKALCVLTAPHLAMMMSNGRIRMVVLGCQRDLWLSHGCAWRNETRSNGRIDSELEKVWCLLGASSLLMVMGDGQTRMVVLGCQRWLCSGMEFAQMDVVMVS